ncbi:uncharacterized protein BDW70DRAFT_8723 [Aspergillus foveolatus]|uniref:uncharacterized protein n=1 Tax=Aspergillus foveolatus TaxID=210207 RepID=UPI003CCD22F1
MLFLSDDDPSNDADAWVALFKIFLATTNSNENLSDAWKRSGGPKELILGAVVGLLYVGTAEDAEAKMGYFLRRIR